MSDQDWMLNEEFNPTFLFVWNGTRTESDARPHSHDHLELGFLLSGKGKHLVGEKLYDVQEGDAIILNEGVTHQALLGASAKPLVEIYIGLTDLHFSHQPPNTLPLAGDPVLHTGGELRLKLASLCASMEAERDSLRVGRYDMLKTYAMQFLLLLIRELEGPRQDAQRRTGQYAFESVNRKYVVERIIEYFQDHYAERISLDQIAGNMYLSPFYISRIFKAETGDTPIRYLIDIRLEKAMEILQTDKNCSIQEVASLVGYEDAYHFSKLFKKRYGISPSAARSGGGEKLPGG